MKKSITYGTLNDNIKNMKISNKSIIKIISIHYFFLIKENQLFIYNFYSWRLIIKNQDIWVNILINRILGIIPVWIIKVHGNIKAYRIAHPWKYKGIKFSIIMLMKLIGLGYILPFYGAVKGIYFFSQIPTNDICCHLMGDGFTWKNVVAAGCVALGIYALYKNWDGLRNLIYKKPEIPKDDIIKQPPKVIKVHDDLTWEQQFIASLEDLEYSKERMDNLKKQRDLDKYIDLNRKWIKK